MSRPFFKGVSLCCLTRQGRLRNSTWRGAHNAPHCGTDSVPGKRKLGAEPESWAPVLTLRDRVEAPAPANGAALNVSTGAQSSPKTPLSSRTARRSHKGKTNGFKTSTPASRSYQSYPHESPLNCRDHLQRAAGNCPCLAGNSPSSPRVKPCLLPHSHGAHSRVFGQLITSHENVDRNTQPFGQSANHFERQWPYPIEYFGHARAIRCRDRGPFESARGIPLRN